MTENPSISRQITVHLPMTFFLIPSRVFAIIVKIENCKEETICHKELISTRC